MGKKEIPNTKREKDAQREENVLQYIRDKVE
jgi:hypothetical protein